MIIAILQARCTSSRLPGKVLMPILGVPMIWHQWQRLKRIKNIDKLVLATSVDSTDDLLAEYFLDRGEPVFRGSLNDVLDRFYQCALLNKATHVVRLTGDCPLADAALIDELIALHLAEKNDYTGIDSRSFPHGLDAEIMSQSALEMAATEAKLPSEREHVTLFINQRPDRFKCGAFVNSEALPPGYLRWTVDNTEDFELVTKIYQALYERKPAFNWYDVLALLKEQPDLSLINSHIKRNTGLLQSLMHDRNN